MPNTHAIKLRRTPLNTRMASFERQNPKVVQAMRLFDMSLTEYQGVMNVMYEPRIALSDRTTPIETPIKYAW